jgi:hypothetical protein
MGALALTGAASTMLAAATAATIFAVPSRFKEIGTIATYPVTVVVNPCRDHR